MYQYDVLIKKTDRYCVDGEGDLLEYSAQVDRKKSGTVDWYVPFNIQV